VKRPHQLLLLGVILAGLLGTYFFLKQKPLTPTPVTPAASARPEIVLARLDQDKINKLVLKSAKANLTLVKQNGVWQTEPAQPFKLNQAQIETAVSTFVALDATEVIDPQPRDLQQYGLTQPAVIVTVYSEAQTEPFTLSLGDLMPAGNDYYALRQDDPKVYAVSVADGGRFMFSANDLRNREELPRVDLEQCQSFKLIRPGQPTVEIVANPARDQTGADYGLNNWIMVQPYQEPVTINIDKFSRELLPTLNGLDRQEYIADRPADLTQYGLDHPRSELIVKDKPGKTLHLLIGKEHDSNSFYAKTPEAPEIFTITQTILPVLTIKPFELVNQLSYIINIDTVDKIEIAVGGVKQTITLSRKVKKARSKKEQDETVTTYRVGGKPIKEDVFKTFYRSLIGLTFEGDHPGTLAESNPAIRATFYLNQGKVRVYRFNYVAYNNDFYAIFRNGHSEFLISKDQVAGMVKDFQALTQGKLKARPI
jgi:hypothetical protein